MNNNEIEFANQIIGLLNNTAKQKEMGEIGLQRINELLNWKEQKNNLKNDKTRV